MTIRLRPVEPGDLPLLFQFHADPIAYELADLPPREPAAFEAHWARLLANPDVMALAIEADAEFAGHVISFPLEGLQMVGYWLGTEFWGRGIATQAFARLLEIERRRPLHARVASHNPASLRILENAGFVVETPLPDGLQLRLDS